MKSVIRTEKLSKAIQHYESDEIELAIQLFQEMAEEGCEESNLYLSLIYRDGDGVDKDEVAARRFKKRYVDIVEHKANKGDSYYKLKLGSMLQYGDGVPADEMRAFNIYRELAEENDPEAQFILYSIYAHGWCSKNIDEGEARKWLERSALGDWPEALCILAVKMMSESDDLESRNKAVAMLRKSLELGHWPAEEHLKYLSEEE